MHYVVTGGAGFIGSHVTEKLLSGGHRVTVIDNLSSGNPDFLSGCEGSKNFNFVKGDINDGNVMDGVLSGSDGVFHLAANPDVRVGAEDTRVHLEQNVLATHSVLDSMRRSGVGSIAFTSTSTVYGEATEIPTPESYGPLVPISLYGASKLACEALITAYCHTFDMRCWMYRLANVIGPRGTHGVIVDFIAKLKKDPRTMEILGDGRQRKSYVHVSDCVDMMLGAFEKADERVNIFNVGTSDDTSVDEIAEIVAGVLGLSGVEFTHTGGRGGWKGDVPRMLLDVGLMESLGLKPRYDSNESVEEAAKAILEGSL
jgi:UDP-glucose 4-epimerase